MKIISLGGCYSMKRKLGLLSAACILGTSIFASSASAEEIGNPNN